MPFLWADQCDRDEIADRHGDDELGQEVDPFDLLYEADDEDEDP